MATTWTVRKASLGGFLSGQRAMQSKEASPSAAMVLRREMAAGATGALDCEASPLAPLWESGRSGLGLNFWRASWSHAEHSRRIPRMPPNDLSHFGRSVLEFTRPYRTLLRKEMSVGEALEAIRSQGMDERIVYFYVVDDHGRLAGVLPTRRLLTAPLESRLGEVMIGRVLAVPSTATLLDACDLFVLHKFLALPVIDENRRVVGVLDIAVFTEEVLELPSEPERADELFEALGFHLSQVRGASPAKAFRFRFPWLLATIASGSLAAVIATAFQKTLTQHVVVACFLALVLALGEAVTVQSMTLTLQALRTNSPTRRWFLESIRRESLAALLLGGACGLLVFGVAWVWSRSLLTAAVTGASVFGGLLIACLSGLAVPSVLHALKLDPKIAAGPAALALTDVLTLLLYLSLASRLL